MIIFASQTEKHESLIWLKLTKINRCRCLRQAKKESHNVLTITFWGTYLMQGEPKLAVFSWSP